MFVHRLRPLTQSALAIAAAFTMSACEDPVAQTDLRPDGEPEVLAVLVFNDVDNGIVERATFCKTGDPKRPGQVSIGELFETRQICEEDLSLPAGGLDADGNFVPGPITDAVPDAWYIRIMFDELLDPNVEELIEITEDSDGDPATPEVGTGRFSGSLATTQPVILRCTPPSGGAAVAVDYDGYYSPSGNAVTWPLGPSLFIQPTDPSTVATGSTCTVEIKDSVVDKQGNPTPAAQRGGGGEYTWEIAPLAMLGVTPAPAAPGEEEIIAVDAPVVLEFNAPVDPATLTAGTEVVIRQGAAGITDCAMVEAAGVLVPGANIAVAAGGGNTVEISITGMWTAGLMYAITFSPDNAVTDLAGGPGAVDPGTICFIAE